jgi:hypothetical protein
MWKVKAVVQIHLIGTDIHFPDQILCAFYRYSVDKMIVRQILPIFLVKAIAADGFAFLQ